MGLGFDYERVLEFAKNKLGLPESSEYLEMDKEQYLTKVF
jgi:hypothetical protein